MLVFVHINKTGGTTVCHILRSSYGVCHCQVEPWHARWTGPPFSNEDFQRLRRLYPSLKSIAGHRLVGYIDLHAETTPLEYFTFIRDPLTSCASRFQYKVQVSGKKDLVFEDWIQQDWTRNHQTKWIGGTDDVDDAINVIASKNMFVGLAERFDESLVLLRALVANDLNISYRRVNVAQDNTIKQQLLSNKRTRQILSEAQAADLRLYDFVTQELYPTYRHAYGPSLDADVEKYRQTRRNAFNVWKLTLSRLKHYGLYVPALRAYRRRLGARREETSPQGVTRAGPGDRSSARRP